MFLREPFRLPQAVWLPHDRCDEVNCDPLIWATMVMLLDGVLVEGFSKEIEAKSLRVNPKTPLCQMTILKW